MTRHYEVELKLNGWGTENYTVAAKNMTTAIAKAIRQAGNDSIKTHQGEAWRCTRIEEIRGKVI